MASVPTERAEYVALGTIHFAFESSRDLTAERVGIFLQAIDKSFAFYMHSRHSRYDCHLRLVSAWTGSFMGELAALIKSIDDFSKLSDHLGGFIQSILDGVRYLSLIPDARKAPQNPPKHMLVRSIADLLNAVSEYGSSLTLSVETDRETITVKVDSNDARKGLVGLRQIPDMQVAPSFIHSHFSITQANATLQIAKKVAEESRIVIVLDEDGSILGLLNREVLDEQYPSNDHVLLKDLDNSFIGASTVNTQDATYRHVLSLCKNVLDPCVILDDSENPMGVVYPHTIPDIGWIIKQDGGYSAQSD